MFKLSDLHNHSLFGIDDGADSFETTCAMIERSYAEGVRRICFTPHFLNMPEHDASPEAVESAFGATKAFCAQHFPDMELYLGCEMSYHFDCIDTLAERKAATIADTRYVLVDFLDTPDARSIKVGVERILNRGYIPIVAHVERYQCLIGRIEDIRAMSMMGAVMQINASSLFKGLMSQRRRQSLKLLSEELVDLVASDAHDLQMRPPELKKAAELITSKFGYEYAEALFSTNPDKIISNERL